MFKQPVPLLFVLALAGPGCGTSLVRAYEGAARPPHETAELTGGSAEGSLQTGKQVEVTVRPVRLNGIDLTARPAVDGFEVLPGRHAVTVAWIRDEWDPAEKAGRIALATAVTVPLAGLAAIAMAIPAVGPLVALAVLSPAGLVWPEESDWLERTSGTTIVVVRAEAGRTYRLVPTEVARSVPGFEVRDEPERGHARYVQPNQ